MKSIIFSHGRLILFIAALLVAFGLSSVSRSMQYADFWQQYPERFYTGDTPVVSTLDAYKWVRIADEYRNGTYGESGTDVLMYYPDGHDSEKPLPLLSVLLARLAPLFGGSLYEAGLWLIPWLAGLFMIPFAVYFYRLGYPVAGILGATLGTFCFMYYLRTSPGRIDTDALTLFFPFLTALFMMLAVEKGINRRTYIYGALAGLSQNFFYWWYQHAAFILVFFVAFVAVLVLTKMKPDHLSPQSSGEGEALFGIKEAGIALVLYILCANPYWFLLSIGNAWDLLTAYFFEPETFENGFPNVYRTVSEARHLPFKELLQALFINPVIILFAVIGLGIMTVRQLRLMLPVLPVFAIGLLTFFGSIRFIMFLTPFLALGIGYLINYAVLKIPFEGKLRKELIGYAAVALFVFAIWKVPFNGFIFYGTPDIAISPQVLKSFETMGEILPEDAAVYTWWDYGLAIEAEAGLATFHDGMTQNTLKTWMIARSYTQDQTTLAKYARYIANNGMEALNAQVASGTSATEIVKMLDAYGTPLEKKNVYISFSPDMIYKYGSISYIGNWNIIDGMPPRNPGGIDVLSCTPARGSEIMCGSTPVSLGRGMVKDIPLKRVNYLDLSEGRVTLTTDWHSNADLSAVAFQEGGATYMVLLVPERVYQSAFFQLYIMGNYDPELYEEVINTFPVSKVYKLK